MMKKVLVILVTFIAFVAISCEKEEVALPLWEWDYDGVLLGEWVVVSSVDNETFAPFYVDIEGVQQTVTRIGPDDVFSFTDVDKWRAKGHTFAGTLTQGEEVYFFEWYIKENSLMIIWDDPTIVGERNLNTNFDAEFQYSNTRFVDDNETYFDKVQLERYY
jgi:hypothetical protein